MNPEDGIERFISAQQDTYARALEEIRSGRKYIGEKKIFPITFEIFPANLNKEASFTLYEDDGESRDYERDVFCKTKITSKTTSEEILITIAERESKGFIPADSRNLVLKIHAESKPKDIFMGTEKLKSIKADSIEKNIETDFVKMNWSWNEAQKIISIKVPDSGKNAVITIKN